LPSRTRSSTAPRAALIGSPKPDFPVHQEPLPTQTLGNRFPRSSDAP
jgi:hypothetical protein